MNNLFTLPGEIRNLIYGLTLIEGHEEQEYIELEQVSPDGPFRRMRSDVSGDLPPATLATSGLPLTCKALRQETLKLYYSLNKFYFQTEYLKSKDKASIVGHIQDWVNGIGPEQAREIRDVTISLSSLKGQAAPCWIEWEHMRAIRKLFHPNGSVRIKFCLEGNGTATFTLGRREDVVRELERMEEGWCWIWQRVRRMTEAEARALASTYRREVERLLESMPEMIC